MVHRPGKMLASKGKHQEERAFLESYNPDEFDRPSVTVDVALLTAFDGSLHALLLHRAQLPHRSRWALPGGFVQLEESLDEAALRILKDKAGLSRLFLEQLYTFGAPRRDPRMRIITVAYYALIAPSRIISTSDSKDTEFELGKLVVPWAGEAGGGIGVQRPEGEQMKLAFDHGDILSMAVKRLRGKLNYTPIGFQLLPKFFTLRQLQEVHETILGRTLNKDSFRRRMLASGSLKPTGKQEKQVGHRPAELYGFVKRSAV